MQEAITLKQEQENLQKDLNGIAKISLITGSIHLAVFCIIVCIVLFNIKHKMVKTRSYIFLAHFGISAFFALVSALFFSMTVLNQFSETFPYGSENFDNFVYCLAMLAVFCKL
eukprot:Pgem_evm1s4669